MSCDTEFMDVSGSDVPIVCTLTERDRTERLRDWQAVLDVVEERRMTPEGAALRFPMDAGTLAALARVAALEVACCSFFSFTLTLDANGAWLAVGAPSEARALVLELFGPVDG